MIKRISILLLGLVLVAALAACGPSGPAPAPTSASEPTRTAAPVVVATAVPPTNTAVPPTDTPAPTNTVAAGPTSAGATSTTVPATATATRPPATATVPAATAQPTKVSLKYVAPELLEPKSTDTRVAGKDTFRFRWKPIGDLGPGEFYQVQVAIVNPVDNTAPGQPWYVGCNADNSGMCLFVLSNKPTGQDYLGLLAAANRLSSPNTLKVRWSVTVVLDQGGNKFTPVSPSSDTIEFTLQNP